MKRFASLMAGMLAAVAFVVAPAVTVSAVCTSAANCIQSGVNNADTGAKSNSLGGIIKTIVNILLFVLGAAAVIMIVVGGIRFTTSNGNPESIKTAKNTILYSVIGVVVAIMAYAIVDFTIDSLVK